MDKKGRLLGEGNTAEIYEWETDKILKLFRKGLPKTLCSDEFHTTCGVYHLLHITSKPIEIINIEGRFGAVYERICGKTMLKAMMLKPWTFAKYAKKLAQYHKEMQQPVDFML